MSLSGLLLLPAALVLDRILSEPPSRIHPVCAMGKMADFSESFFRRMLHCPAPSASPAPADRVNAACPLQPCLPGKFIRERMAGILAGLAVLLPWTLGAFFLTASLAALHPAAGFAAAAASVWLCMAPQSLADHALNVELPLARGDLAAARLAVSRICGRRTEELDSAGVARACVESVAENLTDGVLATLFWAAAGFLVAGLPAAAALVFLQRAANTLDAMWGKKNERYRFFGTFGARADDVLGFLPARLALPVIVAACCFTPKTSASAALHNGWSFRRAHESPNSAWSEAPFAGALGLKLGGPAVYGMTLVQHPEIGTGTKQAETVHIRTAVRLMRTTAALTTLLASLLLAF